MESYIKVKKDEIETNESWQLSRLNKVFLFKDLNKNDVYAGDCVSFYIPGSYIKKTGYINMLDGVNIKINCFDNVFNKWFVYGVE